MGNHPLKRLSVTRLAITRFPGIKIGIGMAIGIGIEQLKLCNDFKWAYQNKT